MEFSYTTQAAAINKNDVMIIKTMHDGKIVALKEIIANNTGVVYRVGCDSLNNKDKTVFISTLVGIHPGRRGAFILYCKTEVQKIDKPEIRLWEEVERAIEFASYLRDVKDIQIECIDFDLNTDVTYESSRLAASAVGYAQSAGFKAYCKPALLYAVHAADFIVNKGIANKNIDINTDIRKRAN